MKNQITDWAVYSRIDNSIIKINYVDSPNGHIDFEYINIRGEILDEPVLKRGLAKILLSSDYNRNDEWKIYTR